MCLWWEAEVASCTFGFSVWRLARRVPAILGWQGPGSGSFMYVLMYVHFHSLGTLHNPIGAVAPWGYTHTSTSRIHRMYAECLVYYTYGGALIGRTCLGIILDTNLSRFLRTGRHSARRGEMSWWCTTCVFSYRHSYNMWRRCLAIDRAIQATTAIAIQQEGSAANPKLVPTKMTKRHSGQRKSTCIGGAANTATWRQCI